MNLKEFVHLTLNSLDSDTEVEFDLCIVCNDASKEVIVADRYQDGAIVGTRIRFKASLNYAHL